MRILGIDPGSGRMGWGVLEEEAEGETPRAVAFGVLEPPRALPLPRKLRYLFEALQELLDRYRPHVVAVEELFFARNATTALAVGQARGVVLLAAALRELPVAEYSPATVKVALTGYGRADKVQMQRTVQLLLGLEAVPRPDDAADALAVALCHLLHRRFEGLEEKEAP